MSRLDLKLLLLFVQLELSNPVPLMHPKNALATMFIGLTLAEHSRMSIRPARQVKFARMLLASP
jgi:hypothetical protein